MTTPQARNQTTNQATKPISQLTLAEFDAEVDRLRALVLQGTTPEDVLRLRQLVEVSSHLARRSASLALVEVGGLRTEGGAATAARSTIAAIVGAAARTRTPVSVRALHDVDGASAELVAEVLGRYRLQSVRVEAIADPTSGDFLLVAERAGAARR